MWAGQSTQHQVANWDHILSGGAKVEELPWDIRQMSSPCFSEAQKTGTFKTYLWVDIFFVVYDFL